jgi:hypothetical protein
MQAEIGDDHFHSFSNSSQSVCPFYVTTCAVEKSSASKSRKNEALIAHLLHCGFIILLLFVVYFFPVLDYSVTFVS